MAKPNDTINLKRPRTKTDPGRPIVYQIKIEGYLDYQWADRFGGMTITLEDDGDTLLTGPIADQAALFGLLKKIRNLGLQLVSIDRIESDK